MSAQPSIKSTPPSDKGGKRTSSKPTRALSGVPSAAMSARSGIKSMAPSDKGSKPTSSKSTQARAKAEAAKVRLRYARQKAVLKMKLAIREAEIQKELAVREAEIQKEKAAREAEIQKEAEKAAREAERAAKEAERAARKAEAAKVRLRYARQEAVLKMKLATREAEIQKERAARQREEAAREAEIQKERAARQREEAAREAEIQKERAARQREEAARETEIQKERAARQREEAAREAEIQKEKAAREAEIQKERAARQREEAAREAEIQKEKAAREAEIQKERAARQRGEAAREAEIQKERAARQREEAAREAEIQKERAAREAEKAARQREEAAREAEIQKERAARQKEEAARQKEEAARQREEAAREAKIQKERAAREAEIQKERAAREAEKAAREAETQLEMAKISTELQVLQLEREGEAAMAEAEYIEEAEGSRDLTEARPTLERTRLERTSDYVQYQTNWQARLPSPYLFDNFPSYEEENLPSRLRDEVKNERADNRYSLTPKLQSSMRRDAEVESRMANSMRNVRSQSYRRQRTSPARMPLTADPTLQYLARRDLVTSGLYQFDDKPENYRAWHSTFTNVIDGVQLSATQRLDLMAKWLGKESRDQVRRMRSVYINKPELALSEAWERLWERYGAPDIIEAALYRRLENFPKVSAKDHFKLREFGDLLMEIQGAKEDGYSAGLVYLDTPSGIRPIVDKLPFGLQDKWLTVASEYKEEHGGRFPPFEHLTEFVRKEAKRRNDPSLVGPGRSSSNVFNIDKPVSVLKTEALTTNNDPGEYCPLHNKPHPLKACRMFREKPLEERTALLKEKRICFRCCSSTSHLARECTIAVKCPECDSTDHVGAMHPGLSPQTDSAPSPPQQDGGEGKAHSRLTAVSTNCTEVCGQAQSSRSCSKICLTKVYPKGAKDKAIKAYVILDDQSNRSLVSPEFFKLFNIESERFPYYLKTCSGNMETQGRKAEGIQIKSLDGKVVICLPPLLECNEIMNNRAGIPTPSAVLHQPHLHHIAKHIPELDPKAEILLLLGRDVIQVHKVRQQVNGPLDAPFAQRLDLGWVVIGEVCLGDVHKPTVDTLKTNVLESGRHSIFQPCTSSMYIKEA
ncbi:plectin-like [Hypanus sabinus]|uniref:plectin-like n=1 Tax=Hypanus sabinus TaxID=79690 RepID=UPI0028C3F1BC|nr:plectin-like [Hypanus sabinus]